MKYSTRFSAEKINRFSKIFLITVLCAFTYKCVIISNNHILKLNFINNDIELASEPETGRNVTHPYWDNPKEWIFKNFIIANQDGCTNRNFDVLLLVHSNSPNFERRSCYRKYIPDNFRMIFLLGESNDDIQNKIDEESQNFGDIVEGNFKDSFRNLSYKAVMGLTWAARYCSSAQYIVKIDDDVFINHKLLTDYLETVVRESLSETSYFKKVMFGRIKRGSQPQREKDGKWHISESEYPAKSYPPYLAGSAYITTIDVFKDLLMYIPTTPFLAVDDVYITGLVRRKSDDIVLQSLEKWWSSSDPSSVARKLSNKEPYPFMITVAEAASPCAMLEAFENCIENNCFCCYNDKRKVRKMFNETSLLLY